MLLKKIIKANDLKEEKIMVARQAMQDQEIPDFIEHKQIVAVFTRKCKNNGEGKHGHCLASRYLLSRS